MTVSKIEKGRAMVSAGFMAQKGHELMERALELAAAGDSLREICRALSISHKVLQGIRNREPEFNKALEVTMVDASRLVLDQIKEIPWIEPDVARPKIKIEALKTYREMRWPAIYGERMELTVRTIDLTDALQQSRERAQFLQRVPVDVLPSLADILSTDSDSDSDSDSGSI